MADRLRIGSLCSGYGGLDLAVQAVLGGELAWVADNDPGAAAILAHRLPGVPNLGDIATVDWARVEPVDVLCAGFPCADVSQAGQRAGLLRGNRSGIWHEVARAISVLRPGLVVLENVRGLLSARGDEPEPAHLAAEAARDACDRLGAWLERERNLALTRGDDDRARRCVTRAHRVLGLRRRAVARARWHERRLVRAIGTVLGSLADLGYDAQWVTVPASAVGAPHERMRVFICAWLAADPDGAAGGERRQPTSGQAAGRGSRADARGRGGASAADPAGVGQLQGQRAGDGRVQAVGGETLGRTGHGGLFDRSGVGRAAPAYAEGGEGCQRDGDDVRPGRGEDGRVPSAGRGAAADVGSDGLLRGAERDSAPQQQEVVRERRADPQRRVLDWRIYEPAVRRWEATLGRPAPRPTEPGRTGERLSPRFVEWLMGLPAGWVTDVPGLSRNAQLKALGNGVVPQQAAYALRLLLGAFSAEAAA